jgi:hypothetical protein
MPAYSIKPLLLRFLALILSAGIAPRCRTDCSGQDTDKCRCPSLEDARLETQAYLARNSFRYNKAIARAKSWLDKLTVSPAKLRAAGIKGKKKLVELLDAYMRLHAIGSPDEKTSLKKRIKEVVSVTYTPEYHNMLSINDKHFKQDATSYLRAAYLMEKLGLDTSLYRKEIRKIHSRLNDHMKIRGSHQRMVFHRYYKHFGLEEPFDLAAGFKAGVIASRLDPYGFKKNTQVYNLTHEVFVPYDFGDKLDVDFFTKEDIEYLRHALARLTVHYIMKRNPDITAELISCIRYLRITDLPVYREGLEYLLKSQHPDGKWGSYERYRKRYGDFVNQGYYLHTTTVAIDALTIAFHYQE